MGYVNWDIMAWVLYIATGLQTTLAVYYGKRARYLMVPALFTGFAVLISLFLHLDLLKIIL